MTGRLNRAEIYRRIFLAAWGFGTVVLVFVVALLVFVLLRQEHAPAVPAPGSAAAAPAPAEEETQLQTSTTKEVELYFADKQNLRLVAEKRAIEFTEFTTENCRQAIEGLIHGPQGKLDAVLSPDTRIRGLYLLPDGELVVDFTLDLAAQFKNTASASFESLMIYSIVNTVTQEAMKGAREPAVAKVRLLMEGSSREAYPVHADIRGPFTAEPAWISTAGGPAAPTGPA